MAYMLKADWFGKAVVTILSFLNFGIYSLVRIVCILIMNIANTTFNDELLGDFQTRIYIVLAVYMLFKLSISLLNSIVNPDALLDKEKGMQKIIPRTIVALIMLIMFPTIFGYAMEWQNDIVQFIPRIIIGRKVDLGEEGIGGEGEKIAAAALSAFITPNSKCESNGTQSDGTQSDGTQSGGGADNYINVTSIGDVLDEASRECEGTKKEFKYEFSGLISAIVGIVLVFILVTYCIDIAIRVLKLGILKILSPIPIISYIDPKSEKNGAFGNWLKECISTYVELFIKMGILYFTLFVLGNISNSSVGIFKYPKSSAISTPFIILALIIGAFFFMGQAAQFICNILGIKYDKGSGGVLGKALAIAGGAALGAVGAAITHGGLAGVAAAALEGGATGMTGRPLGAFGKGRDIATQFKSGGKETKYTPIHKRMQDSLRTRRAAKDIFGANVSSAQKTIDDAKKAMLNDASRFDQAQQLLNSGHAFDFDGIHYETPEDFARFSDMVYKGKDSLKSIMNQSNSKYNDLKEAAQYAGFRDLNKSSATKAAEALEYFNENDSYRAVRNSQSAQSTQPAQPTPTSSPSSSNSARTSTTSQTRASNTPGPTVAGVPVSQPNKNGERTTASGIILGPGVDIDNNKK